MVNWDHDEQSFLIGVQSDLSNLTLSPIIIEVNTTHDGGSDSGLAWQLFNYTIYLLDPCLQTTFATPVPLYITLNAYFSTDKIFEPINDTVSLSQNNTVFCLNRTYTLDISN